MARRGYNAKSACATLFKNVWNLRQLSNAVFNLNANLIITAQSFL